MTILPPLTEAEIQIILNQKYAKTAKARRLHIKRMLRRRHGHKIDQFIAELEQRLVILKEIRDEQREGNNERDRSIVE